MIKKTYKDFGLAIEELRQNTRISYDTIAFGIRRAQSYVYGICTRRKRLMPSYEQMKEFSDFFHVSEDYFYEFRLKRMLENIDTNRDFLDHCEKEFRKWNKPSPTPSDKKVNPVDTLKPRKKDSEGTTEDDTEETA
jgi:transcriptional regulator with XRE-family HTH domain